MVRQPVSNADPMLFHYLKIASRIFTRNKLVSMINVFGLSVALTGCLLIGIFIHDELRYDRFHEHADRIYRVTRNYINPDGSVQMHLGHLAPPFAPLLKNDFPDIIESVRMAGGFNALISSVKKGKPDSYQEIENAFFVEPSAFKIFSIKILSGNRETPLDKPLTLMISDEAAQKYFGTTDVAGKEIKFFEKVAEITGTFQAFPPQSHWHPNALVSFATLNDPAFYGADKLNEWENNSFQTYVRVTDDFDPEKTAQQFPAFIDRHMPIKDQAQKPSASTRLFLQPLTSIHLHSHLDSEVETNGDINHVYAMGAIGVFLIVIACFNFINLSIARATQRGKEVGLRKVSGAGRSQLIFQYIGESTLTTSLAMIIAVAAVPVCLVWLNAFTSKSINLYDYTSPGYILVLIGFVLITGTLAGLYPAFVISGFKPAQILKGQSGSTLKGGSIRRILVVAQFGISIVMIIATLIIYQQLDFLNTKALGYKKEQVITFSYPSEADDRYDAFYHTITQHPAIVEATRSSRIPTVRLLETNYVTRPDLSAEKVIMKNVGVDRHFFGTYNIPLVSGKNFQKETRAGQTFEEGVSNGFILNESACTLLGWQPDEAVGKEIVNGGVNGTVTGVVKDFHFESLHEPIAPIVFITYVQPRVVSVLIAAPTMKEAIDHIAKAWKQLGRPDLFTYEFLDERYRRLYDKETQQQELFIVFAAITIFIASLGLFGLATFNAVQRSKEVSIRKTLGASVQSIVQLLSKEIVVLILIANVLAWPVAWYFMQEWLNEFAYHIEMNVLTYFIAGAFTLFITLITISTQTLRAALTNPATMLRNE